MEAPSHLSTCTWNVVDASVGANIRVGLSWAGGGLNAWGRPIMPAGSVIAVSVLRAKFHQSVSVVALCVTPSTLPSRANFAAVRIEV